MTISNPLLLGIASGTAWSLINLWGLRRLSTMWLHRAGCRRTLAWFCFKFPCLYAIAIYLLTRPAVSPMGFSVGVTVVLAAAGIAAIRSARIVHGH